MVQHVTEEEMTTYGLGMAGFNENRKQTVHKTTIQRFRGSFGPLPITAAELYVEIQSDDLGDKKILKPNLQYFLMTLMWLNSYKTAQDLSGLLKLSIRTINIWIWLYVDAIQALKAKKVSTR